MNRFEHTLAALDAADRRRSLPPLAHDGKWVIRDGRRLLNLSSNDYLGLAADADWQQDFWAQADLRRTPLGASSSRLLTGNFPVYDDLEQLLAQRFNREAALLFNSGYHANIGILPALADKQTLIVADKLVHASLIDGMRLAGADYVRYRHNDYAHLRRLLEQKSDAYRRIIIVTESIFSMDGDVADLPQLVALKNTFANVLLYVDEAHAVGAYGDNGLGMAEALGCIADIDILVGTFGKALASVGAYAVCSGLIKDYLINHMRPLIFATALPPLNIAWSHFVFERLPQLAGRRAHLAQLSETLRTAVGQRFQTASNSRSCIIPCITGSNRSAVETAANWQRQGYYCLPIRPPTVPDNSARVRLSLNAAITAEELAAFVDVLNRGG